MIKVSVIVPVYNVEKYISKCLESLVNQTLKEIEIIAVNDGSPDNSQKIIDKFQKKYSKKIKSFIKDNEGQGSARNLGLKYAKGEYISFVDSDDFIDKEMLEKMYNLAKKDNSDIVICDMKDYYSDGTFKEFNCTKYNSVYEVTPSSCNKIFRKSIIGNIKFLNKLWYEDFNFTTKMLLKSPKISVINKSYYCCNSHNNSTMNNNNSLKNLDMLEVMEDLIKYAKINNYYDENLFTFLIFHHILITSINRVARQKNKDKKKVIKEFRSYCHKNIPNYKKYPFYRNIKKSRKVIASLNYHGFYYISKLIINIKSKLNKKMVI